jgi:hypothetical protein
VEGEGQSSRGTEGLQLQRTWRIVWRWLIRLMVVGAFVAAVAVFYSLLQQAGVLDGEGSMAAQPRFQDVPEGNPYHEPIEEVVDRGIMTGFSDDLFAPRDSVNRGQFATVLVKAMEWRVSADESQPFGDLEDREVLNTADYIAVVYQRGVMSGRPGEPPTFAPEDPMALEHAIVAAVRAGGDRLQRPITPDADIQRAPLSPALQDALQIAQVNGLLTGLGVDLEETDFGRPLQRQQLAALMVNLRTALRL